MGYNFFRGELTRDLIIREIVSNLYKFRHNDRVISIRTGRYISKEDCKDFSSRHRIGPGQWNAHLLIEDPFDRTNVARLVTTFFFYFEVFPNIVVL